MPTQSWLNWTISLNTSKHHLCITPYPLKITFTWVVTEHQLPTTIFSQLLSPTRAQSWTTDTCRPKLFTSRPMQLLFERSNKAFSMRRVQASCGHPLFKENCCILCILLYWLFSWADTTAHFGYLVLKSWLKALVNLSITGMVWFVHALKKKRKKRKKKKKSERKTLKKGNKIKK